MFDTTEEPSDTRDRAQDKIVENLFVSMVDAYICRIMILLISQASFKGKLSEIPVSNGFCAIISKVWQNHLLKKNDKTKLLKSDIKIDSVTIHNLNQIIDVDIQAFTRFRDNNAIHKDFDEKIKNRVFQRCVQQITEVKNSLMC